MHRQWGFTGSHVNHLVFSEALWKLEVGHEPSVFLTVSTSFWAGGLHHQAPQWGRFLQTLTSATLQTNQVLFSSQFSVRWISCDTSHISADAASCPWKKAKLFQLKKQICLQFGLKLSVMNFLIKMRLNHATLWNKLYRLRICPQNYGRQRCLFWKEKEIMHLLRRGKTMVDWSISSKLHWYLDK